ncbi:hypothetical protein Tco_0319096 [Tanacetum coccineum]
MPQTHFPIKLTSSNFPVWRKQIQSTLIGFDLLQYIDGTLAIPSQFSDNERKTINPAYTHWYRQDQTYLSAIRGSCSDMIQPIISSASSSKEAWERLLHRDEFNSLVAAVKVRESPITYSDLFDKLTDFERMLKEKDSTSLPIIPTVNVTQRQNSKGTQSQRSFQVVVLIQPPGLHSSSVPTIIFVSCRERRLYGLKQATPRMVNKLSQFMPPPCSTQLHLQALKRVLRYLKGTIHHGLFLNRKSAITLTAFSDSNWRVKSVSRSSTEAEYKALANASAEMMWVQNLLHELGMSLHETPTLFCDNSQLSDFSRSSPFKNFGHEASTRNTCCCMKEMDRYRCTLRPETVEALYCAKDWLRSEIFVNMDSVVKMEFPI